MTKSVVHRAGTETSDVVELSPRQRQILLLLRSGASNKDIASDLNIGVGTVKQHLVVLFRKLGVTSRTAAISKSLEMGGLGMTGPEAVSPSGGAGPESRLERRPVAVLSLRVGMPASGADADDGALRKRVHQAFSDVGFDFGAVFFTHEGGRCDLILGIRQARRHDALRAVRAAFAVHDRLHRGHGARVGIRAAVACGTVMVSTDASGAWTGEALAGAVITNAQTLAESAPEDTVALDGTARGMIDYLERGTESGVPESIAIDAPFVWRHAPKPVAGVLAGRVREQEQLRARLYRLRGGANGVVRLGGETGMGKTTLLTDFQVFAEREHVRIERFAAAIPDSQPNVTALGRIEVVGSDAELLTPPALAQRLRREGASTPRIVLIDDTHLLGAEALDAMTGIFTAYAKRPVLFILAHRGPDPLKQTDFAETERIRLGRVDREAAETIARGRAGDNAPFVDWAVEMAAGVPGFLCQICDYLAAVRPDSVPDLALMPPLTLFSMIAERLEGLGLDRGLLSVLVRLGTPCPRKTVASAWVGEGDAEDVMGRMVSAGVIEIDAADRVSFRHPVVGWVAQHMTVSSGAATNEVFGR